MNQEHSKRPNQTAILSASPHPGAKMPALNLEQTATSPARTPWRLRVQISGDSHTTIGVEVKDKILIGRVDDENKPELDLTTYGAESRGVSRRHAQIVLHEQGLFVEDLNSTNGTRLNGFIIEPGYGYKLRDGDELEMGQIRLLIRFVRSPNVGAK